MIKFVPAFSVDPKIKVHQQKFNVVVDCFCYVISVSAGTRYFPILCSGWKWKGKKANHHGMDSKSRPKIKN